MASKSRSRKSRTMVRIIAAMWIILIAVMIVLGAAKAEKELEEVWIFCQPDSFVYVRMFPKKDAPDIGRLELGESTWTDCETRNGYLHIYGHFECDGWVHVGFVSRLPVTVTKTGAEVLSKGRVACRRYINGTRRKWLKNGFKLTVYAYSEEWSITSEGFIKTKFLTWEGKEDV